MRIFLPCVYFLAKVVNGKSPPKGLPPGKFETPDVANSMKYEYAGDGKLNTQTTVDVFFECESKKSMMIVDNQILHCVEEFTDLSEKDGPSAKKAVDDKRFADKFCSTKDSMVSSNIAKTFDIDRKVSPENADGWTRLDCQYSSNRGKRRPFTASRMWRSDASAERVPVSDPLDCLVLLEQWIILNSVSMRDVKAHFSTWEYIEFCLFCIAGLVLLGQLVQKLYEKCCVRPPARDDGDTEPLLPASNN
jgi:hypothetical protein